MLDRVTVEAGGRTLALRLTFSAMCRYQEMAGEPVTEAIERFAANPGDMLTARRLFTAALSEDMTEAEAGKIMDELGIRKAMRAIGELIRLLQEELFESDEDEVPASGNAKSPRKKAG
jgi:hypothetical protein